MKKSFLKKYLLFLGIVAGICILGALSLIGSYSLVNYFGKYVLSDSTLLPECHAALVLGCAKMTRNGPNYYFRSRMKTAAELYYSGKVKTLLLSGDNGRTVYNEPEDMRQALIQAGVPDEKIYCDYAGFRTLDSVRRADKVFGQKEYIIVSQKFHCERAIFLARFSGLEVWGYPAPENFSVRWRFRNHLREVFARMAAVLDIMIGRRPKFYGPAVDMTVPQVKAD